MAVPATGAAALAELVGGGDVAVLSGAGLSTESGIPDYRGPTGQARRADPMTYQRFVGSAEARRRYWARSHVGWREIGRARPNAGHRAVAALQRHGLVTGIVSLSSGLMPVGAFIAGVGADFVGPRAMTLIFGVIIGAIAVIVFFASPIIREYRLSEAMVEQAG